MDVVAVPGGREERGSHFLSFALDLLPKALYPTSRSEQETFDYCYYGNSGAIVVEQNGCPLQIPMTKLPKDQRPKVGGKVDIPLLLFALLNKGRGMQISGTWNLESPNPYTESNKYSIKTDIDTSLALNLSAYTTLQ